jgi:hypothetical protein
MKRRAKFGLVGLVAVITLPVVVAEVSAHVYRRRAERLLYDVRQLQVGKSTFEDARAVIVAHGGAVSPYDHFGCSPTHCTFEVGLEHYPLFMKVWGRFISGETLCHVLRILSRCGLLDLSAGITVTIERGIVTHTGYGVLVRGNDALVLARQVDEFKVMPEYLRNRAGQRSYFVDWVNITTVGGGEGIHSILTPQANAEERNRAYDFDFDCLTKLRGCTSLCQFAPSAFADLVKESHYMPWLDEHDPGCAKFKRLEGNPNQASNP